MGLVLARRAMMLVDVAANNSCHPREGDYPLRGATVAISPLSRYSGEYIITPPSRVMMGCKPSGLSLQLKRKKLPPPPWPLLYPRALLSLYGIALVFRRRVHTNRSLSFAVLAFDYPGSPTFA